MRFKTIVIVLAVAAMLATLVGTAAAAKPGGFIDPEDVELEIYADGPDGPYCVVRAETSIVGSGWLEHRLTVNELTPREEMVRLHDGAAAFLTFFFEPGADELVSATYDTALYADRNKTQPLGVLVPTRRLDDVSCFPLEPWDYINLYAKRSGRYWSVTAATVGWELDQSNPIQPEPVGYFTPQPGGKEVVADRDVVRYDLGDLIEFYSPPFDKKLFDSVDFRLENSLLENPPGTSLFSASIRFLDSP